MWSFEKIHRFIAHLFLGELVTTFDEEFRILFAQSEPLVMENVLGSRDSNYLNSGQFGLKRSQSFRHPQGSLRDLSGYSFGDRTDTDRNMHPFRRDDSSRHSLEPSHMQFANNNKFLSQQFRTERPYIDQSRSMMTSRQIQDNAYKRHSYAEGTLESYSSARQFMKHRVMNNLDETDSHNSFLQREQHLYQGGGSTPGHGLYKSLGHHQIDEYSDSGHLLEGDPPGMYKHAADYLSSSSSKEIKQSGTGQTPGEAGWYNQTNSKRPSVGQPYACQRSPTQLHPPENKRLWGKDDSERPQHDPSVKEGLRSWRINSFLSNIEDSGEEGLSQPLGPDAFDEPPQPTEGKLYGPEASVPRFSTRDHPKVPTKPELLPRFGKPILPRVPKEPHRDIGTTVSSSVTEGGKVDDAEITDARETLSKHDSFRSRVNPMLLRSSRLRSSLIFSSSKLEEHSSALMKSGSGLNDEEDNDRTKTSSIVAQILEKRRSLSREPYDWRKQKRMDIKDTCHAEVPESEEPDKVTESSKVKPNEHALEGEPMVTEPVDPPKPATSSTIASRKMTDPESRLLYFKDQMANKKAPQMASESLLRSLEPATKKPDLSETLPDKTLEKPTISITPAKPSFKEPEVPPITSVPVARTPVITVKPYEPEAVGKIPAENYIKPVADVVKKEATPPKSLKPFPSPKAFKKETLKPFKSTHFRHVSCGEEVFTDATDAEKSELKKSRSHSSSGMARMETGEKPLKKHGSSTSLNIVDGEGKALEFLKKQTQRLKGLLGTKGDKKAAGTAAADDKTNTQTMRTVPEVSEDPAPKIQGGPQSSTRYQSSTSNVLYSSNLRDDTKVILEQISANSQKNRIEMAKQAEDSKQGGDTDKKVTSKQTEPSITYHSRNWFQRAPSSNPQERDSLLKRIESLRKEKKVYSRFEVFYRGKEDHSKSSGIGEKVTDGKKQALNWVSSKSEDRAIDNWQKYLKLRKDLD